MYILHECAGYAYTCHNTYMCWRLGELAKVLFELKVIMLYSKYLVSMNKTLELWSRFSFLSPNSRNVLVANGSPSLILDNAKTGG